MGNPFEYVGQINEGKKDIIRNSDNPELAEKDYNAFIINRSLSYFIDTVLLANDMNERAHIRNLMQFDYLINSVRPKKRFTKFAKKVKNEDLEVVSEWYGCNYRKAEEYLAILSNEQIEMIKTKIQKGGLKK